MAEGFLKANARPITLEAAKLHAVLVEFDRFIAEIQSLRNVLRGDIDRQEALVSAQRALLGETRTLTAETAEQFQTLLRSASSVMQAMAEAGLANSIAKAVILDVYAELIPRLKEESEKNSASSAAVLEALVADVAQLQSEFMANVVQVRNEFATVFADAIAGKPPLPPVPPRDAPFADRANGHLARCLARARRCMVSVTHAVVLITCVVVLHNAVPSFKLW